MRFERARQPRALLPESSLSRGIEQPVERGLVQARLFQRYLPDGAARLGCGPDDLHCLVVADRWNQGRAHRQAALDIAPAPGRVSLQSADTPVCEHAAAAGQQFDGLQQIVLWISSRRSSSRDRDESRLQDLRHNVLRCDQVDVVAAGRLCRRSIAAANYRQC